MPTIAVRYRKPVGALAKSTLLASASAIGFAFAPASAQEVLELDTVVVEGEAAGDDTGYGPGNGFVATRSVTASKTDVPLIETPQSISIVTSDQIEEQGSRSIRSALRYSAGVFSETTGSGDTRYGGFQIRGLDSTPFLFRDGLRLPSTSTLGFQSLDVYGAERIEVLKGPASVLYGQNGPGGLINYVSKRPTLEPIREISVTGGQFDTIEGAADLGGKLSEDGTWLYRLTGVARNGGSQVDNVDDDRLFIAPAISWLPSADTSLTILANYQQDRTGWGLQFLPYEGSVTDIDGRRIGRNRFLGETNFDDYDTDQASITSIFEHRFNETLVFRQNARFAHLDNEQRVVYGGGFLDVDEGLLARFGSDSDSTLNTFAIDNQAQADFDTGVFGHTLLVGLDYRTTKYEDRLASVSADPLNVFDPVYGGPLVRGANFTDNEVSQDQIGVYAQDQIRLGNLSLVVGGRNDWADTEIEDFLAESTTSQSESAFSGKAALIYNFDNGIAPYVSYSEAFLPVLESRTGGGLFEPETSRQWEAGVKYQPVGLNAFITAAVFDIERQDVVRFVPTATGLSEARQTGEITSRGFEIEGVASLTDSLDLRAAYTYLDVEITKDPGRPTEGLVPTTVPEHTASLWADYTLRSGAFEGLGFGGGVRYVGSSFANDLNTLKVPDATVADATVSYTRGNYELAVNATNIFDRKYVASCFNENFGCFYNEGRKVIGKATLRW